MSCRKVKIEGKCSSKFQKVHKVFEALFRSGWEYEGASVAIYHKGELVVDMFAGYADRQAREEWTPETRSIIFSITKGVSSIAIAMLVERGHLKYSDKVSGFWPEFGQHGKENITVECVMNHKAGLAVFDDPITLDDAEDPKRMAKIIERTKPNWEPGAKSGYHAVTFGWLVDQIIRRVDPMHRGMGQFVREEIAEKHGLDFHIGIKPELLHTVSRLSVPTWSYIARECLFDPRVLVILGLLHVKPRCSLRYGVAHNPNWMKITRNCNMFNNKRVMQLEQPGALGISRAKDVGKIFSLFIDGSLISKKMLELYYKPQVSGWDTVIGVPIIKGHGFFYERHPRNSNEWIFGHPGYGGSTINVDPHEELVIVYITNGLKMGMGQLARSFNKLRSATYDSIEKMNK